MVIPVSCACGKQLSVKDDFAGRKVKCPACQKLLTVPAAEENDEDEFAEELPQTSRGGRNSASSGKGSKKGKKSGRSGGGLVIGLVAGAILLVVALAFWLLWPSKPDVVANAPVEKATATPATGGASDTASISSNSPPPAAVPVVPMASNPSPSIAEVATTPAPATGTESDGDFKTLQGAWQVSEVALPSELPKDRAAAMSAQMKLLTWTIKGDVLTMSTPGGSQLSTIKLDPSQTPKTIDLIPLDGQRPLLAGLYSVEGETWKLCMTESGKVRPQQMKPDQAMLLTFHRGTARHAIADSLFDFKAWQAAEPKLKAMQVFAIMDSVAGQAGVTEGVTHVVYLDPPATADGTMSPKLWAIVSSLSHVTIRPTYTTDATLQQVSQHPGLVGLNLSGRISVTSAGIAHLKPCSHLRGLYFSGFPVSADLLSAVSQLSQLRGFGIRQSPVSNEMLAIITQLDQLESLSLQDAETTDADVAQLMKLTKLKSLALNGSKVTDTGLKSLKSLKDLTHLDVRGLNVTPQAVAEFEVALPQCKVFK